MTGWWAIKRWWWSIFKTRWRGKAFSLHSGLKLLALGPKQRPGAKHRRHLTKPDKEEKFPE
jgi:hypothetical protein